uniref:non-specific serine/threonine protein kinase n=1 Tax=Rattus norvegicus TaxID=10116 RepID=A0ABK0LI72_RAT|nr:sperm motility kinase Y-like [Rattus norvegicus]
MSTETEEELPPPSPDPSISEEGTFHSQYKVLKTIGKGSHAKVLLAHHRLTGTPVAVKVLRKNKQWFRPAMTEANIMRKINHPNIVSLLQVIENKTRIYLIMELVEGQQLYQYIRESGHIEEDEARQIFEQILSAVSYCHGKGIVHRDLKLDNIMIDKNKKVKVIDFGLSIQTQPGEMLNQHCGAYSFGSPELFLGLLYDGMKNDMWTIGVVLYYMVVGKLPFDSVIIQELQKQVVAGVYPAPCGVSEELENLLSQLLTVNPMYRPTASEVMKHAWFEEHGKGFTGRYEELLPLTPDLAILDAMKSMGFQASVIKYSLMKRKYNEEMATYCFLQQQALQGYGCTAQAQQVSPVAAPFPSLDPAAAFRLEQKRGGSLPVLGTLRVSSSHGQVSHYGQKAHPKAGKRTTVAGHLRPLPMTPTQDHYHKCAMSVPCIQTTSIFSKKSSNKEIKEDNLLSHRAPLEDKPIPSRVRHRGFKGWTRNIANALIKLCCCLPRRKKPRLGQNSISPQK